MERMISNPEGFVSSNRSSNNLALQLRYAAERGRVHDVKKLLEAGAGIHKDSNGLTALHKAAKRGHGMVVKQLVASKRFDVNMQDKYGWTPLHWSAWSGQVSAIQALLSSNKCNINALDRSGSNALHCAALNGHTGVIRVLVPVKCDLNKQRQDGWTPLHLACWNGHHEVVHELITSKCNVNTRTSEAMGALHLAAAKGHDEIAQELLDAGIAPDMQDKNGNTALHDAAKARHLKMVKVLMMAECRVNVRNSDNETPIDIAQREGFTEITTQLSGLNSCNLQESCGCLALRKILFQDKKSLKSDELKKLKWSNEDGENIVSCIEEKIRKSSDNRVMEVEQSWEEKLKKARADVLRQCESRIAEVEMQCKRKVAMIERQCSQRMNMAKVLLGDGEGRSPSAPNDKRFNLINDEVHAYTPIGLGRVGSF